MSTYLMKTANQQMPQLSKVPAGLLRRQENAGTIYDPVKEETPLTEKKLSRHQPPLSIQPKLAISQPNDPYEQEADQVAEKVMRMPAPAVLRKSECSSRVGSGCRDDEEKDKESLVQRKVSAHPPPDSDVPPIVHEVLKSPGELLDASTRAFFEPRFGHDFSNVRVHTDAKAAESARAVNARAYTSGNNIVFGSGEFFPSSYEGGRLLTHELVHTVQQGVSVSRTCKSTSVLLSVMNTASYRPIMRQGKGSRTIEIEIISSRDEYQQPGSKEKYRVGDAVASSILMDIQERGTQVIFRVFNFETGVAQEMTVAEWSYFHLAEIGGSNAGIKKLGRQLSAAKWRSLWPNPMPELLRMFEAGQISLDDEALLSGYHGMIRSDAARTLDKNEQDLDEILGAPDRVRRLQEFTTGLREASLVRDVLVKRKDELSKQLVAQHSFRPGPPIAGTGPNIYQQMRIHTDLAEIDNALAFWLYVFPLLTRFQTREISEIPVETKLREIKSNIVSTREDLNRNRLDPMKLDMVRARLSGNLGPRATERVAAEDRSRSRWAIAGAGAATVATIAILFLPGGIFIDAVIGISIAGTAFSEAAQLRRGADTGMHVDDGLVSQSQAQGARFAAVLATVLAVLGGAAAGFRILRLGLALRGLGRSMPELALAERGAVARAIADDPTLLSTFTQMAPGDTTVSTRVAMAVQQAAGDVRALRSALGDIARIAAIPRRVLTGPDLYEPLRQITDGSDISRIATQTGLSRAEVELCKRNLMFNEHILVDDVTGIMYRGRFTPFSEVATIWGRAARGEVLKGSDLQFLRKLVRHERFEGALLNANGRTLEQAFLHGNLEGLLRTFLRSKGKNKAMIDDLISKEPKPITPYRYAHIVAHYSGAPNP